MEENNENITIIIDDIIIKPIQDPLLELLQEPIQDPLLELLKEPIQDPVLDLLQESLYKPSPPVPPLLDLLEEPIIQPITIPKIIFIVPYRDREQQKEFFMTHMKTILSDIPESDYQICFSHQMDTRDFNRGAMKNIGFLAMKNKYPDNYKNITFVFNDIDTMPYTKNFFNYETVQGSVKHFYGYEFALGGIVSIKGSDFEKISGFPNLWTWGYEDNLLQKRVLAANLRIDRSQFYPLMDKNVFQMKDGLFRIVNRREYDRVINNTKEGIQSIRELNYEIKEIDNTFSYINITNFLTEVMPDANRNKVHDLRTGLVPFSSKKNYGSQIQYNRNPNQNQNQNPKPNQNPNPNPNQNQNPNPNQNQNPNPNPNQNPNQNPIVKRRLVMKMFHM